MQNFTSLLLRDPTAYTQAVSKAPKRSYRQETSTPGGRSRR